jgi:(2Fe-2S) ferredoxin
VAPDRTVASGNGQCVPPETTAICKQREQSMTSTVATVYVCMNTDCKSRGAELVFEALRQACGATGLEVKSYICFSACNSGPNVVATAPRCWFSDVRPDDVESIVNHLRGGPPVEWLQGKNDPDLEEMIFGLIDAGLLSD